MKKLLLVLLIFINCNCGCEFYDEYIKPETTTPHEDVIINYPVIPWTNGIIYYRFGAEFTQDEIEKILMAMITWEIKTNIKFTHSLKNTYIVHILKRTDGVSSATAGMKNIAYLRLSYFDQNTLLHELGHIIGLQHEHQRPDRTKYIQVNWDNLKKQKAVLMNYWRMNNSSFLYDYTKYKYDYRSVMHYGEWDFSINGKKTIEPLDKNNSIVFSYEPTEDDFKKVNEIYK
jgi:hypothetical protein